MADILGSPYFQQAGTTTPTPITDFNTAYAQNPWELVTSKTRMIYDPMLRDYFRRAALYSRFATYQLRLEGTEEMTVTSQLPVHADFNRIGQRDLYAKTMYQNFQNQTVKFARYGGKMQLHEYD